MPALRIRKLFGMAAQSRGLHIVITVYMDWKVPGLYVIAIFLWATIVLFLNTLNIERNVKAFKMQDGVVITSLFDPYFKPPRIHSV